MSTVNTHSAKYIYKKNFWKKPFRKANGILTIVKLLLLIVSGKEIHKNVIRNSAPLRKTIFPMAESFTYGEFPKAKKDIFL